MKIKYGDHDRYKIINIIVTIIISITITISSHCKVLAFGVKSGDQKQQLHKVFCFGSFLGPTISVLLQTDFFQISFLLASSSRWIRGGYIGFNPSVPMSIRLYVRPSVRPSCMPCPLCSSLTISRIIAPVR